MKKLSKIIWLVVLLFFPLVGGCWDSRAVDDQVYALAVGVDKGVDNKLRITIQYPTYKGGAGEQSSGGGGSETVIGTVDAPSLLEAMDLFGTSTRRISLVHLKAIIFSEDVARDGVGSLVQPIARFRETRRIMQVIICKGKAEDYIKENKTLIGQSLAKAMELKASQSDNTGFFPLAPFNEFYRRVISPYANAYAIFAGINEANNLKPYDGETGPLRTGLGLTPERVPKEGDLRSEYVGTAVFNGDKLVGSLDTYETRYFLMLTGQFERGTMTIVDEKAPSKAIVLDLRLGRRPEIKATLAGDTPKVKVNLNIEADIISIQSRLPYEKPEKIGIINKQLSQEIERGVKEVIEKSQQGLEADVFGFGHQVAKNFLTIQEFEKFNWKKRYPKAEISVEVEANVRRTGLMVQSSPIIYNDSKINSEKP